MDIESFRMKAIQDTPTGGWCKKDVMAQSNRTPGCHGRVWRVITLGMCQERLCAIGVAQ